MSGIAADGGEAGVGVLLVVCLVWGFALVSVVYCRYCPVATVSDWAKLPS